MRFITQPLLLTAVSILCLTGGMATGADARVRTHKAAAQSLATKTGATKSTLPKAPILNADGSLHTPDISDAPSSDFERVAWCHGILSGDMELAEIISAVYPKDKTLELIGRSYLRAYEAALTLSGKGKSDSEHKVAEDARDIGYNAWAMARDSDVRVAAGLYANWQLPGDCEHAAVRLSGHPNLFAEMATDEEVAAITDVLASGGPHSYEDLPKPVLSAKEAPADPNAPVSTNTLAARADRSRELPNVTQANQATDSETKSETPVQPGTEKRHWKDGLAYRLGWTNTPAR